MKRVELNEENLLRYGVSIGLARKAVESGLTVSKIRPLSLSDLTNTFSMTQAEATELKTCVVRAPIDKEIVSQLLSASNFTCNVCRGMKSHAYIIHHIDPYEQTQDNSYANLIVLCPSDHDLAHRPGALTLGISKNQLIEEKEKWEAQVRASNINAATRVAEFNVSVNVQPNRDNDVQTLRYLMYFIPFTSLLSHIYYLPSSFNIDFLDVATHMETLMLDRPHGYPFTEPSLQYVYREYLEKYIVLYRLVDGGTNGIPHFLSADDNLRGTFMSRRNYKAFTHTENSHIDEAINDAVSQFDHAYRNLIAFLRANYPEVALDSYKSS